VVDNLFVGKAIATRFGFPDRTAMRAKARAVLDAPRTPPPGPGDAGPS
jgi:ABC-type sugar transport system ATPase subunit